MRARRTAEYADGIRAVTGFAAQHGLRLVSVEAERRLVRLAGTVTQFSAAFGTSLGVYDAGQGEYRSYSGNLSVPASIAASPWAIGCGGTTIDTTGSSVSSEVVWNNSGQQGTGGGISDYAPIPAFQAGIALPSSGPTPAVTSASTARTRECDPGVLLGRKRPVDARRETRRVTIARSAKRKNFTAERAVVPAPQKSGQAGSWRPHRPRQSRRGNAANGEMRA